MMTTTMNPFVVQWTQKEVCDVIADRKPPRGSQEVRTDKMMMGTHFSSGLREVKIDRRVLNKLLPWYLSHLVPPDSLQLLFPFFRVLLSR